MKTAVVYASKYGTTSQIAHLIADGIGATTFDLADGAPDLAGFDCAVLGSPIYAGRPMKAMAELVARGIDVPQVGLFICGMRDDPAERAQEVEAAYPAGLRQRAVATAFLGGRFQFAKMSRIERFIVKRIAKTSVDVDGIDQAAIEQFLTALRGDAA